MITYDEALAKARNILEGIDRYTEYENGYIFCNSAHDEDIGGWYSPCVILKNGKHIPIIEFYMVCKKGKEISTFKVEWYVHRSTQWGDIMDVSDFLIQI